MQKRTESKVRAAGERGNAKTRGTGGERSGVLACNLKASRCFSRGPKEAIRIPRATGGITCEVHRREHISIRVVP